MKFRGKAISGSSMLLVLGVVFVATVIVAAALSNTLFTVNTRDAKSVPIELTMSDGSGAYQYWDVTGDAWVGETYDMAVTATTSWVGDYILVVTVDATDVLTGTEVTMTYKTPGGTEYSTIDLWEITDGTLSYALPSQKATGTGYAPAVFEFTIKINSEISGIVVSFEAIDANAP